MKKGLGLRLLACLLVLAGARAAGSTEPQEAVGVFAQHEDIGAVKIPGSAAL